MDNKTLPMLLLLTSVVTAQPILVELDGRALHFDQPPVSMEGRLMVPLWWS